LILVHDGSCFSMFVYDCNQKSTPLSEVYS
jgi:hypothetical protein